MVQTNSTYRRTSALWMAAGVIASQAFGHGIIPRDTPIERVVENLEARIAEHPEDAEAHYILGRAHALVYEYKDKNVRMWAIGLSRASEPAPDGWQKRLADPGAPVPPTQDELRKHLVEAIIHLNTAIEKDDSRAKYHLALASVLEAGFAVAGQLDVFPRCPVGGAVEHGDERHREMVEGLPGTLDQVRGAIRGHSWEGEGPSPRDQVVSLLHEVLHGAVPDRAKLARQILAEDWREQITEEYFRAMSLALPVDGKASEKPMWGSIEDWVAYEAGTSYVKAVEARRARDDERVRLAVAKATVRAFDDLPLPNGITPIVFRLKESESLGALLDAERTTGFDLDGSGRALRWPWVQPDTAILVWDPRRTGRVTSGRQLFGSVSWWLFFRNGYEALDALDDSRDGELSGEELRGLSLWFDRDSDGVSGPGEVIPIGEFGVVALSTTFTGFDGASPMNSTGLRLADGRVLPTYDWVVGPRESAADSAFDDAWIVVSFLGLLGMPSVVGLLDRVRPANGLR
ncbi:MAG: hypothetical protein ACKVU4_02495 [Phycisphaerales bacterium]